MELIATTAKYLEDTTAREIRGLGLKVLRVAPGAVEFQGNLKAGMSACLELRSARRVLLKIGELEAAGEKALYERVRSLPWKDYLTPDHTFAVHASVRDSVLTHSGFAALKVKDAVADYFRDAFGRRPNVERRNPDVGIAVHLADNRCTLSLDMSGGPLHKRGYRAGRVVAPLNETLGAGILLLMGFNGDEPFADPFCGSGTLCIEAALMATRTAPGLLRRLPFGFERWPGFKRKAWDEVKEQSRAAIRLAPAPVWGSDLDRGAVEASTRNADEAGLGSSIRFETRAVWDFRPPPGNPGVLAMNPPYGDHAGSGEDLEALYRTLGTVLKHQCPGWRAGVLTGAPELGKRVGLKPSRKIPLMNGPMECRLLVYALYAGTKKREK
ncbi:MAG: THUMP domain-containing protein [Acidobacteriota bacterium]